MMRSRAGLGWRLRSSTDSERDQPSGRSATVAAAAAARPAAGMASIADVAVGRVAAATCESASPSAPSASVSCSSPPSPGSLASRIGGEARRPGTLLGTPLLPAGRSCTEPLGGRDFGLAVDPACRVERPGLARASRGEHATGGSVAKGLARAAATLPLPRSWGLPWSEPAQSVSSASVVSAAGVRPRRMRFAFPTPPRGLGVPAALPSPSPSPFPSPPSSLSSQPRSEPPA
eukprot:359998-Chlamydomonas_euryale.AAC.4